MHCICNVNLNVASTSPLQFCKVKLNYTNLSSCCCSSTIYIMEKLKVCWHHYLHFASLKDNLTQSTNETRSSQTVYHLDIQTVYWSRRELKIQCTAEYFWQSSSCSEMCSYTVLNVWYVVSMETNWKLRRNWRVEIVKFDVN